MNAQFRCLLVMGLGLTLIALVCMGCRTGDAHPAPTVPHPVDVTPFPTTLSARAVSHHLPVDDVDLRSVTCPTARQCIAAGLGLNARAVSFFSGDGGGTWQEGRLPDGASTLEGIACADASTCVMLGSAGRSYSVFRTDDGGATWAVQQERDEHLSYLTCAGQSCLATGLGNNGAVVVRSRNAGIDWTAASVPGASFVGPVVCLAADDCWAMGNNSTGTAGRVFYSNDFASKWLERTPKGDIHEISSLFCRDAQHCWASANDRVFLTTDAGTTWTTTVLPLLPFVDSVACSATNCYAVVPGTLLVSSIEGGAWMTAASGGRRLEAIACPQGGSCIAVGDGDPVTILTAPAAESG